MQRKGTTLGRRGFGGEGVLVGGLAIGLALATACQQGSDEENVLPTQASMTDGDGSSGPGGEGASTAAATTMGDVSASGTSASEETGDEVQWPASFRFECIDIQQLGEVQDDGTVVQINTLQNAWNSDIDNYKLNITVEVVSADGATGAAEVGIRSGVGTGPSDMCFEATTFGDPRPVDFTPDMAAWTPTSSMGACSEAADAGAASRGTLGLDFGVDALVYIYAEDDDGTTFNCTPDAGTPDAVPLRAVNAEISVSADGGHAAGQMTGCLLESEIEPLCACLGQCIGAAHPSCGDCPNGSTPLPTLLSGIGPSARCSDLLGANAYDIVLGFNATRLPVDPVACGS